MTPLRIGVLASGRGSNLQAIINAIEDFAKQAGAEPWDWQPPEIDLSIAVVVSNKRGAMALDRAQQHGIKGIYLNPQSLVGELDPRKAYDQQILDVLKAHDVQLVLLAGYMKIVTSLLPSFPGLHAQQQALDAGVKVAGCTVHFVTEGVDEGPIILQAAVPVQEKDTEDLLSARILVQEHVLYPRAVRLFAEGRLLVEGSKTKILETAIQKP